MLLLPIPFFQLQTATSRQSEALSIVKNLDANSPVFQGTMLDLKFTKSADFEKKFVWIDIVDRTIHMSTFSSKERRHREASLSEVSSLNAGLPLKLSDEQRKSSPADRCLTINFKKGTGVDLMFSTSQERNVWYDTLRKIVIYINAVENSVKEL
jgi:hypothetical protein